MKLPRFLWTNLFAAMCTSFSALEGTYIHTYIHTRCHNLSNAKISVSLISSSPLSFTRFITCFPNRRRYVPVAVIKESYELAENLSSTASDHESYASAVGRFDDHSHDRNIIMFVLYT